MQLKKQEVLELFCNSIDNAYYLYQAASEIALHLKNKKYPSLGLAELALEELGKSYSCLAMYSKADTTKDWTSFWKEWRHHDVKAHRAFFYEFFCLLRIEFSDKELKFPTIRQSFSKEKEVAFYVDIDKGNRKIHKPETDISDEECLRRVTSLVGLFNASFYIKDWLTESYSEDFKNAISDYAYLTLTTEIYQQDVLGVLSKMKGDNTEYNSGLDKIIELFTNDEIKPK
ncbi:MAG: AbiV family abortive infection protein [Flavobacteriales bacterium]|nr:AbiV family abortive infection protein [Flavobacteriales bacterium]MCB9335631.1 AbiV family abortive infection protein [Flavobacteriales bacterium]